MEGCLRQASSLLCSLFSHGFFIVENYRACFELFGRFGHALLGKVVNGAKQRSASMWVQALAHTRASSLLTGITSREMQ